MKWEPWEEFKEVKDNERTELPILAPPCPSCRWWQPRQVAYFEAKSRSMVLDSVCLCWIQTSGGSMRSDFSCYESMEGDNNAT